MQNLTATRVLIPGVIGPYDAQVNLADEWNGFARPLFTLDTVRQIATDTQVQADECGSDSVITAHVIDGDPDREGEPRAVVLVVNWQWWDQDRGASKVTDIVHHHGGLYGIGGSSWCWEFQTWVCDCDEKNPWHVAVCQCGQPRDIQVAIPDGMRTTRVSVDGLPTYPALVVKHARPGQSLTPYFALDTVRELAADTQKFAAQYDPRSAETIHVLDTAPNAAGARGTLVLHADWAMESDEGPANATRVVIPNEHGLYPLGPDWRWSIASWWCACETDNSWHDQCSACGLTRDGQPATGLETAVWKAGRLLRTLAPEATSALVDLTGLARICAVYAGDTELDTADDTGVFDTETLGAADEALRQALDEAAPDDLPEAKWEPALDIEDTGLYRITFPPARQ